MGSNYKISYNVDMVFCIDATGSMDGIINMVKKNALNLYNDVMENMAKKSKMIDTLRVRIVAYRDYLADGDDAMLVTDFFELPGQASDFENCVKSIEAFGGGDDPEDGLEALAYAIKSKWNPEGMKKRQVIVVWSDAATHKLGYGSSAANYPKNMATDFNELTSWWGDKQNSGFIDQNAKRLLLFTPNDNYWSTISDSWDNVIHFPSVAGKGLNEFDYSQIIDTISNTI
ncbi:MAG: VWA domain-containing protein [Ruminococcaceae bacterium]|nr:VWA domain-containing protein [Oscillospiraceae bacterium]